jgi:Flp pilus assembly protein TadD
MPEQEQPEEAARTYRQALALAPRDVDALRGLAYACLALKQIDQAEELFRRALALDPNDADAYRGLGLSQPNKKISFLPCAPTNRPSPWTRRGAARSLA